MQMQLLSASWAVVLAQLLVVGVAVQLRSVQTKGSEQYFLYDYSQQGENWAAGSCASRHAQSPIDLPDQAPFKQPFSYKYKPITEPFEVLNNGHTYAADLSGLGYGGIFYNGAWYNLMNINVHSLSEHTWAGKRKPLELHMVHKHYANDHLVIIAVGVESATPIPPTPQGFLQANASAGGLRKSVKVKAPGPAPGPAPAPGAPHFAPGFYKEPPSGDADFNPTLQAFLKVQPPAVNMKVSVPANSMQAYDLNTMMQGGHFYEYAGSLTAPPCAEIATWLVRKDSIKASDKQLMYLHDAIYKTTADFGNYRSLMPLNGRTIAMRMARFEEPFVTIAPPIQVEKWVNPREVKTMKWAVDAMKMAKASTDYIKDLDMRLRNAAQAHAAALVPLPEPLSVHGQLAVAGGAVQPGAAVPILPVAMPNQPPLQMQNMAETMARNLATTATKEINDASVEISKQSKDAATRAARAAAGLVGPPHGSQGALANAQALGSANATEVARLMAQGGAAGGVAAPVNVGNHVR